MAAVPSFPKACLHSNVSSCDSGSILNYCTLTGVSNILLHGLSPIGFRFVVKVRVIRAQVLFFIFFDCILIHFIDSSSANIFYVKPNALRLQLRRFDLFKLCNSAPNSTCLALAWSAFPLDEVVDGREIFEPLDLTLDLMLDFEDLF